METNNCGKCGGEGHVTSGEGDYYYVQCEDCDNVSDDVTGYENAIDDWNKSNPVE